MYLLDNKEILLQLGVPIDAVHVSIVDERERSKLLQPWESWRFGSDGSGSSAGKIECFLRSAEIDRCSYDQPGEEKPHSVRHCLIVVVVSPFISRNHANEIRISPEIPRSRFEYGIKALYVRRRRRAGLDGMRSNSANKKWVVDTASMPRFFRVLTGTTPSFIRKDNRRTLLNDDD